MTIRIEMTNPAEHQPSELRALAVFLNNLADDRETGRISGVASASGGYLPLNRPQVVELEVAKEPAPLPPTLEAGPAAPSASVPMTPPPAPVAPAEPAPATLVGVDLDSSGLPWDGRIHAESKGKIGDGTWRKKRGVDAALVTDVEARLRELVAIPAAPTTDAMGGSLTTPPPAPVAPAAEEVPPAPAAPVTMPPAVEVPAAPAAPAAPVAPAAPATVTIADVFKFATAAEAKGTLNGETRSAALLSLGFNSMVEISTRPDMAAKVIETFKEFGAE